MSIDGKWGNGDDRKNSLTAAGYNYICGFEESYGYLTGPYVRDKRQEFR